jgi:hypothetical protein
VPGPEAGAAETACVPLQFSTRHQDWRRFDKRLPTQQEVAMNRTSLPLLAVLACALATAGVPQAQAAHREVDCTLQYSLTGWSLVYKHTTGNGRITCDNGQSMPVSVSAKALGVTAGKWHIDHGKGHFTDVSNINETLGRYVQASANAGLVKSGEAQVLTKGPVTLALAGAGAGVNLGVDVGAFNIKPAR